MKKWLLLVLFWGLLLSFAIGSPIDMQIYQLNDKNRILDIEKVTSSNYFFPIENIKALNFGISLSNYWLKIVIKNTIPEATYGPSGVTTAGTIKYLGRHLRFLIPINRRGSNL